MKYARYILFFVLMAWMYASVVLAVPLSGNARVLTISAEYCDAEPRVSAELSDGRTIWIASSDGGDRGLYKTLLSMLLTAKSADKEISYVVDDVATQYCYSNGFPVYVIKIL